MAYLWVHLASLRTLPRIWHCVRSKEFTDWKIIMKTVMAEGNCAHLLCLSNPAHASDVCCAMSLCPVSATRPTLGTHTSRTGNGYYNFTFSGSGKILHFWRMEWTVELSYGIIWRLLWWSLYGYRGRAGEGVPACIFVSWPDSAPFAKWQPRQTTFGHSFTWTVILLKPILAVLISWITFLRRHVI